MSCYCVVWTSCGLNVMPSGNMGNGRCWCLTSGPWLVDLSLSCGSHIHPECMQSVRCGQRELHMWTALSYIWTAQPQVFGLWLQLEQESHRHFGEEFSTKVNFRNVQIEHLSWGKLGFHKRESWGWTKTICCTVINCLIKWWREATSKWILLKSKT